VCWVRARQGDADARGQREGFQEMAQGLAALSDIGVGVAFGLMSGQRY
jgi:hypothetical protein